MIFVQENPLEQYIQIGLESNLALRQQEFSLEQVYLERKKYEEGVAAQVAYLDAQTTLTNAAINEVISEYDYYITYANFERIVALYEF